MGEGEKERQSGGVVVVGGMKWASSLGVPGPQLVEAKPSNVGGPSGRDWILGDVHGSSGLSVRHKMSAALRG